MPYYTQHIDDILEEVGIPLTKAHRVRADQYIQEILGTRDLDSDEVWPILQAKLKESGWREYFIAELKKKWAAREWRTEGLG